MFARLLNKHTRDPQLHCERYDVDMFEEALDNQVYAYGRQPRRGIRHTSFQHALTQDINGPGCKPRRLAVLFFAL